MPHDDIEHVLDSVTSEDFLRAFWMREMHPNTLAPNETPTKLVKATTYLDAIELHASLYKRRVTYNVWVLSAFIHYGVDPYAPENSCKWWGHDKLNGEPGATPANLMSEHIRTSIEKFPQGTSATNTTGKIWNFITAYPTSCIAKAVAHIVFGVPLQGLDKVDPVELKSSKPGSLLPTIDWSELKMDVPPSQDPKALFWPANASCSGTFAEVVRFVRLKKERIIDERSRDLIGDKAVDMRMKVYSTYTSKDRAGLDEPAPPSAMSVPSCIGFPSPDLLGYDDSDFKGLKLQYATKQEFTDAVHGVLERMIGAIEYLGPTTWERAGLHVRIARHLSIMGLANMWHATGVLTPQMYGDDGAEIIKIIDVPEVCIYNMLRARKFNASIPCCCAIPFNVQFL